jgi:hypothetical protein
MDRLGGHAVFRIVLAGIETEDQVSIGTADHRTHDAARRAAFRREDADAQHEAGVKSGVAAHEIHPLGGRASGQEDDQGWEEPHGIGLEHKAAIV